MTITAEGARHLDELVAGLSRPEAHPRRPARVERIETHVSVLFLAGDRVHKLKKPVRLPFLDQSTLAARRAACEAELRLNRRTSPEVYLGLRAVVRGADGLPCIARTAGDAPEAEPLDWTVEMVRLPAERMLDALLARGAVDDADLERLARRLVEFHAAADASPEVAAHGTPDRVRAKVLENLDQLDRAALPHRELFPAELVAFLRARVEGFVAAHRELLARRASDGRVREGHGDLHAGNVCLVGDRVVVYDCVEFDLDLRTDDVACDLAFLAMDLDHRGHHRASSRVVELYARASGDRDLATLVPFYAAHRALIRAKVGLLAAQDETVEEGARARALLGARAYFQLAVAGLLPPVPVLVVGRAARDGALVGELERLERAPARDAAKAPADASGPLLLPDGDAGRVAEVARRLQRPYVLVDEEEAGLAAMLPPAATALAAPRERDRLERLSDLLVERARRARA